MTKFKRDEIEELRKLVSLYVSGISAEPVRDINEVYISLAYRAPPFDWAMWKKGQQGLRNAGASVYTCGEVCDPERTSDSFAEFTLEELSQLLLMIHRITRFSDGYYEDQLGNGVVLKILDRMLELTVKE